MSGAEFAFWLVTFILGVSACLCALAAVATVIVFARTGKPRPTHWSYTCAVQFSDLAILEGLGTLLLVSLINILF